MFVDLVLIWDPVGDNSAFIFIFFRRLSLKTGYLGDLSCCFLRYILPFSCFVQLLWVSLVLDSGDFLLSSRIFHC